MISVDNLVSCLRSALCAPLEVTTVPIGFAVSTGFLMPDGDLLSFYVLTDDDGRFHLEDDATTIPDAIARGFDMKSPQREASLRGLLEQEGARYDDDLVIRTGPVAGNELGQAGMRFISALIRTRDLFLMSRENVAASFADDVRRAIAQSLPPGLAFDDSAANEPGSPDIVLRAATGMKAARIFAAGGDLRLMDALVEHQASGAGDSPVIAVVDRRRARVSEKRFNRATNHGLLMAVVDDGNTEWVARVVGLARNSNAA